MIHDPIDNIDLLTLKETAALLRVDATWLRRIAKKGGISHVRIGRRFFFKRHDLCLWLQQRYQKSEQE
ncbi:MAG: helix-turn-helix domain-containing protein [Gammaproteobacteria bacterium]|nr:helix-turn-helix domain-containing protein [Gammaproteobacteria bacterium]